MFPASPGLWNVVATDNGCLSHCSSDGLSSPQVPLKTNGWRMRLMLGYGLTWNLPPNSRLNRPRFVTSLVAKFDFKGVSFKMLSAVYLPNGQLMGNMMIAAIADALTLTLPSWRASVRKARKSVLTHWLCGKVNPSKLRIYCMKIWNLATNIWGVLKRGDPQNHRSQY